MLVLFLLGVGGSARLTVRLRRLLPDADFVTVTPRPTTHPEVSVSSVGERAAAVAAVRAHSRWLWWDTVLGAPLGTRWFGCWRRSGVR